MAATGLLMTATTYATTIFSDDISRALRPETLRHDTPTKHVAIRLR